jgi:hypothetical protein
MPATSSLTQINVVATNAAHSVGNVIGDFVVVLALVAVLFLFAYYVGRGAFVTGIISLYAGFALYTQFPFMSMLGTAAGATLLTEKIGIYAGLSLIAYLVVRRVIVSEFLYINVVALIVLCLVVAAFLLALAFIIFDVPTVYRFSPPIVALFSPKQYFFWWFLAPLAGLFFISR